MRVKSALIPDLPLVFWEALDMDTSPLSTEAKQSCMYGHICDRFEAWQSDSRDSHGTVILL